MYSDDELSALAGEDNETTRPRSGVKLVHNVHGSLSSLRAANSRLLRITTPVVCRLPVFASGSRPDSDMRIQRHANPAYPQTLREC